MPSIKQQWIAALRSGEYKQGVGTLKKESEDGSRYCCIGVLGEIMGYQYIDGQYVNGENELTCFGEGNNSPIKPWGKTLVNMNDQHNYPFSYIANWIEQYIPDF